MSIGTFILIKNEKLWIKKHIENLLPHIDEMVFFDGNSTDGTLEIIKSFKSNKIKLFENKDPKDLQDDYVKLFNECLHSLSTDWAFFCHPDMWVENPEVLPNIAKWHGIAMTSKMYSYAGNSMDDLLKIDGRGKEWKNIYRLRNPDLGAHYFGHYGAWNEDVYFNQITGNDHTFHGEKFNQYSYSVEESGLKIHHFSDVRPYERRLNRMISSLRNQGYPEKDLTELAKNHPRVSLKNGKGFKFIPCHDVRDTKCGA